MPTKLSQIPGYLSWMVGTSSDRYSGAITTLAITLFAYELSNSAVAAGALGTTRMLIAYALAILGGIIVDSYDRRSLMVLRAYLSLCIWSTVAILALVDWLNYSLFGILVCLATIVSGLLGNAGESALRSLVNKEYYVKARSINEGRDASADIIGSPISGFLYNIASFVPFIATCLGQLISLVCARRLPKLPPSAEMERNTCIKTSFFNRALAGFRWIGKSRQIIALTLTSSLNNFGNFILLSAVNLTLIARGQSATIIGIVLASEACGALIGAAISAKISSVLPTGRLFFAANLLSLLALCPLLFSQSPLLVGICYFLYALPIPISNASIGGYKYQLTPINMQGRVSAADTLLVGIPVAFTAVLAGMFVDAGLSTLAIGIGLVILIFSLLPLVAERSILAIPDPKHWPDTPPR